MLNLELLSELSYVPTPRDAVAVRNPVGIDFLRTEIETAFGLVKIASDTKDEEKRAPKM